ncbi:hypothetical protein LCGC14_2333910, partial [marine sediment metagenome]
YSNDELRPAEADSNERTLLNDLRREVPH